MTEPGPTRRFLAAMLMAIGGLMATLCGLCTGIFQFLFLYGAWVRLPRGHRGGEVYFSTFTPLAFGVAPTVLGIVLFLWGRWLLGNTPIWFK